MKSVLERNLGFMGYPNYSVDTEGNVWSFGKKTRKGCRKFKVVVDSTGYCIVCLTKDGKCSNKKIHRLVALAFIPNPENKPCIEHINTDKTDNNIKNLRWATYKENCNNPITYNKKVGENCYWYGKHLTEEHKEKISNAKKCQFRKEK